MDSSVFRQTSIKSWLNQPSVRAVMVAGIVLAVLAVLHVYQHRPPQTMTELIKDGNLQRREIQSLQIAFGKAGLGKFEVKDGRIFVPQDQFAKYLSAAAENDAIPSLAGESSANRDSASPFLSRSQQNSLDHDRRTRQIRQMVNRLPFVDEAWFEMDRPQRQSAFVPVQQSAVVSVRTIDPNRLTDDQAATIKKMIAGAVAQLSEKNVVVIDLQNGAAIHDGTDELTAKQRRIHEIKINQERFYESRVHELLGDLESLTVNVDVTIDEIESMLSPDPVAAIPVVPAPVQHQPPLAGANGIVSIESSPIRTSTLGDKQSPHSIETVSHAQAVEVAKKLKVHIGVPAATVFAKLGPPTYSAAALSLEEQQADYDRQIQSKFHQLKTEIVRRLLPLFPSEESFAQGFSPHGHSLSVKLIAASGPQIAQADDWVAKIKNLAIANWPSLTVLAVGVLLLTIVSRGGSKSPQAAAVDGGSTAIETEATAIQDDPEAEVRFTQMIENDPNSAAKIIETWIRDAA